jgi:PTH1 family peptidyl-tRNA hydrolase
MRFKSEKIILAKPTTLMNRSGQAVKLIQDYYDIPSDNILIAHDDLDIELGEYKIQFAKGPRVHNGVNSVSQSIGTSQYFRVRLGIDNRDSDQKNYMSGKDYVLSKFNKNELDTLKETFVDIYKEILG